MPELRAWTQCIKIVKLQVDFEPMIPRNLQDHQRMWNTFNATSCIKQTLTEVKQIKKLYLNIMIAEDRITCRDTGRKEIAEYVRAFKHLGDEVELDLAVRDMTFPYTPISKEWLPGLMSNTDPRYLHKLKLKGRSKHFKQSKNWLLDDFNRLRLWAGRAFAFAFVDIEPASELEAFYPAYQPFEAGITSKVTDMLGEA